jgi:hypothetical protein
MNSRWHLIGLLAIVIAAGVGLMVMPSRNASPKATQVTLESPRENPANSHSTSWVAQRPQFVAASASLETPKLIKPELPAQIQAYLAQPNQRPKMTGLPLVDATGEALLIQKYREISGLTNKSGLINLMAYTGGDKVFELFANTLTNALAGRTLTRADEAIVGYMPQLIGILARKSDPAFEFLKAGLQPAFWQKNATWKTQTGSDQPRILIGACINGLALSGRKEGKEIVYGFRTLGANPYLRAIDGSVVDSVFMLDSIDQNGLEAYLDSRTVGDLETVMQPFETWLKTTNGMAWRAWMQKVDRAR